MGPSDWSRVRRTIAHALVCGGDFAVSTYPFNRYLLSKEMGYQPIHVETKLLQKRHLILMRLRTCAHLS
jgi:hypothetical protein